MSAAVNYVLRRMQQDPRLAYLIGPGSQCYELLTEEAAQAAGKPVEEFRKQLEARLTYEPWPVKCNCSDAPGVTS